MRKSIAHILFVLAVATPFFGKSQSSLEELRIEVAQDARIQAQRALDYSIENNIPLVSRDLQGNLVLLVGVTDNGLPLFETTDNAGAAVTTGAIQFRDGGNLGLNLQGEGVSLAIWDGGIVDDHIEFDNRILSREGTEEDGHATHVTGTILATGINNAAKGMAPKASAQTFDFLNDTPEMLGLARPDQSGVLLSNHSYALITGWRFNGGWQWFGDAGISNQEDYKFGFYSTAARQWDQLAFNAPYYLIVKSAGNDRNDTGTGNFPPDCNGGSGYDCIGDKSVAKNILTVGAVNKVLNYTGPTSVTMSTFSGWGPTDDGRIKPDLVAAGVDLFSTTSSTTNNQYGTSSGTSMSAPNATGSLVLLQELNKNLTGGNYMRAATLKALVLHTAKEAGFSQGPDYQYGWGLLDVEKAATLMLNQDNQNIYILEEELLNGSTYEIALEPKENTKITATIAWTDPAGNPVGASLDPTNIMLINDLDIRIVDDAGNNQFPWILNPANPSESATKGDNIRDNVEKIEFSNPEPRGYKLKVSHKGALTGGSQHFSLVVEYTSLNDPRQAYYWIGNNGSWNNGSNWSYTSGGTPTGIVPTIEDRVIVDENSFQSQDASILLSADAECHSLTWLTKSQSGISMQNNTLSIASAINISSENFQITSPGFLKFTGKNAAVNKLNFSTSDLLNANIIFDGDGKNWELTGQPAIGVLNLVAGELSIASTQMTIRELISEGAQARKLQLGGSEISDIESVLLTGTNLSLISSALTRISSGNGINAFDFGNVSYSGYLAINETGSIAGTGNLSNVFLSGYVQVLGNSRFENLEIAEGSHIEFLSGSTTTISENTIINAADNNRTILRASGDSPAILFGDGHFKLCFDYLDVEKVDIAGTAVINAGTQSEIIEAVNWVTSNCEDVLFPDFDFKYNCIGALTEFEDRTSGIVTSWEWNFGDPASTEPTSFSQNPYHIYETMGVYSVTLTARNESESRSYTQNVSIGSNPLPANTIVLNNDELFSFKSAESFLWYRDGMPIDGATARSHVYGGEPGVYFVVTKDSNCNIPSAPYLIASNEEEVGARYFKVYPNPVKDEFFIEVNPTISGWVDLSITNAMGAVMLTKNKISGKMSFDVSKFSAGIYFVKIQTQSGTNIIHKIIIQ